MFFIIRFKTVGSNLPQPAAAGYLRRHAKTPLRVQEICCRSRIIIKHTTIRPFLRAPPPAADRIQQNTTINATLYHLHVTPTASTARFAALVLYKTVIYNKMTRPIRGGAIFPPQVSARICPMTRSNNITCFRALLHFLLHLQS